MERLTERDDGCSHGWDKICRRCDEFWRSRCLECRERPRIYDRLTDYEDAEEQGRLIEFPVSLGQHLWFLDTYGIIRELAVNDLTVSPRGQEMLAESSGMISYYSLDHIGKSIFRTREEAEAKLKEMEDEDAD